MHDRTVLALALLNAVLLGVLLTVWLRPADGEASPSALPTADRPFPAAAFTPDAARAQAPSGRARGSYRLLGGEISGSNANAVWVLDTVNQEMIAMRWNPSRNSLDGIGHRDLDADLNVRPTR